MARWVCFLQSTLASSSGLQELTVMGLYPKPWRACLMLRIFRALGFFCSIPSNLGKDLFYKSIYATMDYQDKFSFSERRIIIRPRARPLNTVNHKIDQTSINSEYAKRAWGTRAQNTKKPKSKIKDMIAKRNASKLLIYANQHQYRSSKRK